jgi:ABC-type multidrug transport system fused ATPase/permease subunit
MTEIIISLLALLTNELRKRKRLRAALALLTPVAGVFFVLARIVFTKNDGFQSDANRLADIVLTPLIFLSFATFAVSLVSYSSIEFFSAQRSTDSELESLRKEREELRARLAAEGARHVQGPADVLDTIRLNLNQLTEYYTINKGQAKSSFRASMAAMLIGLLTVLVGIWMFYSKPAGDLKVSMISGVAGILAEFIAGAYFFIYSRSLTQLNYFFEKLTSMQDTMLAIRLCETLPESNATTAKERLIGALLVARNIQFTELPSRRPETRKVETGTSASAPDAKLGNSVAAAE